MYTSSCTDDTGSLNTASLVAGKRRRKKSLKGGDGHSVVCFVNVAVICTDTRHVRTMDYSGKHADDGMGSSRVVFCCAVNCQQHKTLQRHFYNRIFGVPLLCGYCSRTSIFTMCLGSASGPFDDVGSNILLSVSFHPFLSPPLFFFFPFLPQCTLLWLAAGVMRVPWWVAAAFSSVIGVSATRLRRAQIRKATLQRVSGRN